MRWDKSPWTPDHGWAQFWVGVDPHFGPQVINYLKLVFRGDQIWNGSNFKDFKTVSNLATWQYNECLRWDISNLTPDHGWAQFGVGVDLHFDPQVMHYSKLLLMGDKIEIDSI